MIYSWAENEETVEDLASQVRTLGVHQHTHSILPTN